MAAVAYQAQQFIISSTTRPGLYKNRFNQYLGITFMSLTKTLYIVCLVVLVGCTTAPFSKDTPDINRATFSADGSVQSPENYLKWIHVGATVTPDELNTNGAVYFPEFHNIYIEPSAFNHFKQFGKWPEGTQVIKERTLILDGKNCNKETGTCTEASGTGYFQGEYKGLELSVKDTKRFSNEPGGWAYFSFGNGGKPFAKFAKAFPKTSCNSCHGNVAENDYVFTQFYPVLRSSQ